MIEQNDYLHPSQALTKLLRDSEKDLMQRILDYAKKYDYAHYTSTLFEPWRLSISGLSEQMIKLRTRKQSQL